jgi:integrase/recombinase XerD
MAGALADKWPVLGRHERAAEWLGIWVDLGRAPRTVDAYGRGTVHKIRDAGPVM